MISAFHAKYYAHELTRRHAADGVDRLSQSLFDASVDLNPHQIEAALFALRNPLQEGVLLADEVGLGKTIEAALVVCQYWAERRRRLLVICPASLRKQDSYALPKQQRHLTALILRKLLASSSHAVAATLVTIRERLQGLLTAGKTEDDGSQLVEQLIAEDDLEQDYLEEEASEADEDAEVPTPAPAEDDKTGAAKDAHAVRAAISTEIAELTAFVDAAQALQTDTKAQALLKALGLGFSKMAELNAPRKAIIFTESKRTQEYLHRFLSANGHAGKLVLFSGTNNHEDSTAIYQRWLEEYKGTDRVTGSPQVDRRTALIDHFRKDDGSGAEIMIATEAAAEGVNLQFCALIINYDLPWNPQRVEQRIGRCHR